MVSRSTCQIIKCNSLYTFLLISVGNDINLILKNMQDFKEEGIKHNSHSFFLLPLPVGLIDEVTFQPVIYYTYQMVCFAISLGLNGVKFACRHVSINKGGHITVSLYSFYIKLTFYLIIVIRICTQCFIFCPIH